jgi:transposase-like protein
MTETRKETTKRSADEIIDAMLEEYGTSREAVLGEEGIWGTLKKRLVERALAGELTHHLGYRAGQKPAGARNQRNGYSKKRVLGEEGAMEIAVPRDREGSFEPVLIAKGQRRFDGFDQRIIALYARGMTVREIGGFLREQYGVDVGADFISTVTDAVLEEVQEWQSRPLERMYPVVFFDALRVKIRDAGTVKNKAVHLALGVDADGNREVLGIWIEPNEGAKFWMRVMSELRDRGVEDILIAVVDGLKGFPEAVAAVFPQAQVQTCIVHLTRYSLGFCNWKDRAAVARELKGVYRARNPEEARRRLDEFDRGELGRKYPMIAQSWRRNWEEVIPFFGYPEEPERSGDRLPGGQPAGRGAAESNPADDLHDQRDREPEHAVAQGDQEPGALPERRGGHEADLSGLAGDRKEVEKAAGDLGRGGPAVRDPVRGEVQEMRVVVFRMGATRPQTPRFGGNWGALPRLPETGRNQRKQPDLKHKKSGRSRS